MATRHFDSSIVKITADGRRVLSSFVDDDEELVSDIIERKHREQAEAGQPVTTSAPAIETEKVEEAPVVTPEAPVEEAPAPAPEAPVVAPAPAPAAEEAPVVAPVAEEAAAPTPEA